VLARSRARLLTLPRIGWVVGPSGRGLTLLASWSAWRPSTSHSLRREIREFSHGRLEVFQIAGQVIGRASYDPGWRWSEHVGPLVGADVCQIEHVGLVISGRCAVKMVDGSETTMSPGDLFAIPPGHDSWVVGDEPYVSLHFSGADTYAAGEST